ncbi:unnamed protein product [Darwinula stevensoni]|uniref:peptidylprolyl isomerase n=1 Tax=Darwinula stevensoni TaxID=69355 RepID=A0A7R9AEH5_9CRUS|nr:unnamed protein product [Darwinula stevensoni]CAG0902040.1 unnamed protein product [Darwinula stevensoni]
MIDTESPAEKAAEEAKMKEMASQLPTLQAAMATTLADAKAGKLGASTTMTKGGVKVITLTKGTGAAMQTGETAKVNYIGTLLDGTKFDDSFSRGATLDFPVGVGRMIPGFDEAVGTMTHGTKAVIVVPSALGYGDQANGPIPAKSDLAFYIELL